LPSSFSDGEDAWRQVSALTNLTPRKVRFLRPTEVATVTRASTEEKWEQLNNKLDQRVRELLADGFDVELG